MLATVTLKTLAKGFLTRLYGIDSSYIKRHEYTYHDSIH